MRRGAGRGDWLWLAPGPFIWLISMLAGCTPATMQPGQPAHMGSSALEALPGWDADRVAEAMPALIRGCARLAMTPPDQRLGGLRDDRAGNWASVCAAARAVPPADEAAARTFLTARFDLVRLTDAARTNGLFTGYYEPEVAGSRERTRLWHVPLLTRPADLAEQTDASGAHQFGRLQDGTFVPYYSRAEIDQGALRRQRLDLLYLKSPVDLFFLQIQGAGRIELPNGHVVRVGYAGSNGQPYMPIGRVLSARGALPADGISAQAIREWLDDHPREVSAILEQNPRYTFFREVANLSPGEGPLGTLGVPLTPGRSIAVDPRLVPLGAPVWIDTTDGDGRKLQRLMVAQDTGAGIAGGVRADIFYGWGEKAERDAGRQDAPGAAWVLLPRA